VLRLAYFKLVNLSLKMFPATGQFAYLDYMHFLTGSLKLLSDEEYLVNCLEHFFSFVFLYANNVSSIVCIVSNFTP
jgi:hypothetical protein